MKKYLNYILAFMLIVVMTLTGCGNSDSGEDNAGPGNIVGNITEKVAKVNPNGSLDLYTKSGVNIKAQEKTFDSDVRVKVTESKLSEGLSGDFSKISDLFTISAEKVENTSLGEKVISVTSVEKPVIITVPNNTTKEGVYYLGTRPNSSQPWKYKVINGNNSPTNPLVISSRFAANGPGSVFYVSTYNVDFQFAVFVETTDKPIDSKTVISDIKASAEPSEYTLENGYYKSDLTVKTSIYGDNVGNLSASDYIVEIGFLNDDRYEYNASTFPIVGASANYEVSEAGAGAGNKYKHTITLKNISDYSNNTLSFIIGASKLTRKIFPDNFTVTISVDGKSDVIACENTKGIILTDKTSQDDPTEEVTYIKVVSTSPANSETGVATDSKSVITIEFEKELNPDTYWGRYVTMISGSEPIPLICEYDKKVLTLKHSIIPSDQVYTVRISEGIEGAEPNTKVAAYAFAFSTGTGSHSDTPGDSVTYINVVSASVENGATDVATAAGNITINFDKELADNDWTSFVALADMNGSIPVKVSYSNKTLAINHKGLNENTPYTLVVKGGMKGVEANTETAPIAMAFSTLKPAKTFITAEMMTPATTSDVGLSSSIVIAFSDGIKWEKAAENLVTLSVDSTNVECVYSYSDTEKSLTLAPSELLFNKTYTVKVSKFLTPLNENAEMQGNQQFEFTTVASEGTPSITSDPSKSVDNKYYLVADQKFSIDFNKVIINEEAAKQKIYMQKDGAVFHDYSVEFDSGMKIANINVSTAFEADKTYKVGVTEFTDNDGSTVKAAENSFTAMSAIELESIEINSGSDWQQASGSSDIALTGKIRATLTQPVEPAAVKFVDKNGSEIAEPVVSNKTTEKSTTIEFDYNGLSYLTTYGVVVSYTDAETGQSIESSVTFTTSGVDHLILADPSQPNSEDNPYLVYCAAALDQIRENEYFAKDYYFKQMADIDLNPEVYNTSANNTQDNGWKPFGRYDMDIGGYVGFIGHYDGNGMTVSNMKAHNLEDDTELMSLFGAILSGSVSNLTVENVDINGIMEVGAIAGYTENTSIDNCHSSGNIICQRELCGGLVGDVVMSVITNSDSSVNIKCKSIDNPEHCCAGGLIGKALYSSCIISCHATGNITGYKSTGGLIGYMESESRVSGCYTSNNSIEGSTNVGGLVGYMEPDTMLDNCQSKNINIKATEENAGGITGLNEGRIIACHSSGNIEGNQCVGGVAGKNLGEASRSDSKCFIKGNQNVGGIIGESFGSVSLYDTDDSGDYDKIKFYGKVEGVETDDPYDVLPNNKSIYIGSSGPA